MSPGRREREGEGRRQGCTAPHTQQPFLLSSASASSCCSPLRLLLSSSEELTIVDFQKKEGGGKKLQLFPPPNLNSNSCLNYVRSEQVRKQVVCAVCPFVAPRAVDSSNLWEHYSISDSQRQDGEAPAEPQALFMEFRDKTGGLLFFVFPVKILVIIYIDTLNGGGK